MGLLNKLKFVDGSTTIGIDAYSIYNPGAINGFVNNLYDYLPLPEGQGPFGLDYRTIIAGAITATTLAGGLVLLVDSLKNSKED